MDVAAVFGSSALLFVAACCAIIYFTNDRALLRFRRAPDLARIDTVSKDLRQMVWCVIVFFACFLLVGMIVELVVPTYALAAVLAVLLRVIFGASRKPLPLETLPPAGGGRLPYFMAGYGGEGPRNSAANGEPYACKVFMTPSMLACAKVVNRVRKDGALRPTFFNMLPNEDAVFYDAFDVTSPAFLKITPHNDQIDLRDVVHIKAIADTSLTNVGLRRVSGLIVLWHKSGKRNELIILGRRDVKALAGQLRSMVDALRHAPEPAVPEIANP